ncbi:MAG TPA: type III pantothenate kinase [Steroidobacteraceae bacterium]|nr:type III pantothenate kinase [Steroidobacteraceae bacterium]
MILLIDIGNTRVKWAPLRGVRVGRMRARAHEGSPAVLDTLIRRAPRDVTRVVAVNVAGARFERALVAACKARFGFKPEIIQSTREACGVRNGYREVWRLGADRWVGVIGAKALARARSAVVANAGTALTLDAVSASGRHLGGAIVPGATTMVDSLLKGTNGIARRARGMKASPRELFAADTASALAAGAQFAAAAVIDRAVDEAAKELRATPLLILTGGAAPALRPHLRHKARVVPDLVLHGLAVLARGF